MGFVYLINIEKTSFYKIGITRNKPEKRLKQLQTGNCEKLVLTDQYQSDVFIKIETILHRNFKHKKFKPDDFENLKGEWFEFDIDFVKNFRYICKKIEKNYLFIKENSSLFNEYYKQT
jgi:hypothetical protein